MGRGDRTCQGYSNSQASCAAAQGGVLSLQDPETPQALLPASSERGPERGLPRTRWALSGNILGAPERRLGGGSRACLAPVRSPWRRCSPARRHRAQRDPRSPPPDRPLSCVIGATRCAQVDAGSAGAREPCRVEKQEKLRRSFASRAGHSHRSSQAWLCAPGGPSQPPAAPASPRSLLRPRSPLHARSRFGQTRSFSRSRMIALR